MLKEVIRRGKRGEWNLSEESRSSLHMAALSGVFWFAWAFGTYLTVYLQSVGFSASQIGILNALMSLMSIAAASFWGTLSDRIGSVKKIECVLLLGSAVLYALVPAIRPIFGASVLPFFLFLPMVNFFRGAVSTYNENLIIRNCNEQRLHYGRIRSIGSFLFTVGAIIISSLLPKLGTEKTFLLQGILFMPALILTFTAREPASGAASHGKKQKINPGALFKNRKYLAFLAFTVPFYIAVNFEGSFIPFFMAELKIPSNQYGILLSYRALLEIPFLLLMTQLRRRFSLKTLIWATAVLMGVECAGFALLTGSFGMLVFFATFFGLGNGLFIFSSLNYIYEVAPDNMKASAQAFFAATSATAGIIGNVLGGVVYDLLGGRIFYLVAAAFFWLSAMLFALLSREKKQEAPAHMNP